MQHFKGDTLHGGKLRFGCLCVRRAVDCQIEEFAGEEEEYKKECLACWVPQVPFLDLPLSTSII